MEIDIDSCDGALWHIESKDNEIDINTTLYRYQDKAIKPDELGFRYYILTYKTEDKYSAEVMSAYIGDVRFFIDNHAKAGYNGVMVKHKAIPKKTVKQMFHKVLSNWQFPPNLINAAIKQV